MNGSVPFFRSPCSPACCQPEFRRAFADGPGGEAGLGAIGVCCKGAGCAVRTAGRQRHAFSRPGQDLHPLRPGGPGRSASGAKYVEYGGPDGGDGGKGGDIIFEAVTGLNTLIDFRYTQHFKAQRGHGGAGKNRTGAGGNDLVIKVPLGTQVLDDERENVLADLTEPGQRVVLLRGGDGGRGNLSFKSSTNRARASAGRAGRATRCMSGCASSLADAGLVGLPNAGKSTFINQITNTKAKVGDYAFTTTRPQLGVVRHRAREFVLADIPGLIAGAAEGAGIGDRFLGHIERCRVLIHLIDIHGTDPAEALAIVEEELAAYGAGWTKAARSRSTRSTWSMPNWSANSRAN
jgi:GTP-binding protein